MVVIIHIYGDKAPFLLFLNHQDVGSEWGKIENSVSGPIFTQKNTKFSKWPGYSSSTILEKIFVAILHIYEAKIILLLFCDHQCTESE